MTRSAPAPLSWTTSPSEANPESTLTLESCPAVLSSVALSREPSAFPRSAALLLMEADSGASSGSRSCAMDSFGRGCPVSESYVVLLVP